MAETRAGHTATLLRDGRVLATGGAIDPDGDQVLASAELYDPASGSWTTVEDMSEPRSAHTATLLPDGRVLVVGGIGRFVSPMETRMLASAELYDPATGRWTSVERTADPRSGHTATLLPDGKVLVAGGALGFGRALASAEVYDPGRRDLVGHRRTDRARYDHTATLMATARCSWSAAERRRTVRVRRALRPGSGRWTHNNEPGHARTRHTATLLTDGKVIVVGGTDLVGDVVPVAELYDPGSGS